jgi:hypothetical protein
MKNAATLADSTPPVPQRAAPSRGPPLLFRSTLEVEFAAVGCRAPCASSGRSPWGAARRASMVEHDDGAGWRPERIASRAQPLKRQLP